MPTGTLNSNKNGFHRIFQIYEIPNAFPERVGILGITMDHARLIASVGGDLPHLDIYDIRKFMDFYKKSIDTMVRESLKDGPQKVGFSFIMNNVDHTVIEEGREFAFNRD